MFSQNMDKMKTLFFFLIVELFKLYNNKKQKNKMMLYIVCFIVVSQKINEFQI